MHEFSIFTSHLSRIAQWMSVPIPRTNHFSMIMKMTNFPFLTCLFLLTLVGVESAKGTSNDDRELQGSPILGKIPHITLENKGTYICRVKGLSKDKGNVLGEDILGVSFSQNKRGLRSDRSDIKTGIFGDDNFFSSWMYIDPPSDLLINNKGKASIDLNVWEAMCDAMEVQEYKKTYGHS